MQETWLNVKRRSKTRQRELLTKTAWTRRKVSMAEFVTVTQTNEIEPGQARLDWSATQRAVAC